MTSVCTLHGVFPAPEIRWTIHYNHSESLVESKHVHTKTEQDPENYLYTSSSTLHIPADHYRAITCLCHNPTSNTTLNATYTLSKGRLKVHNALFSTCWVRKQETGRALWIQTVSFCFSRCSSVEFTWPDCRSHSGCCSSSNSSAAAVVHTWCELTDRRSFFQVYICLKDVYVFLSLVYVTQQHLSAFTFWIQVLEID